MKNVKSFTFYLTYYDVAQELEPESRGLFYNAIAEYMFSGKDMEKELPFDAKVAFKCIKANLKLSKTRSICGYEKKQVKSRAKANAEQNESKSEANAEQNESKSEANAEQNESKSEANAEQNESKHETSIQEYKYSSNQAFKNTTSNSAQSKAPKFDQPCVSGAEEAAADDGSTWEWDELLEELRA